MKTFNVIHDDDKPSVNEIFNIKASLTNAQYPEGAADRTMKTIVVTITELPSVTLSTTLPKSQIQIILNMR